MNIVTMSGNIGHDPELRSTSAGMKVTNVSIAVHTGLTVNGENKSEWFEWVIWDKLAELVAENVKKGDTLVLTGKASKANHKTRSGEEYRSPMFVASECYWSHKEKKDTAPAQDDPYSEELPF